MKTTTIFVSIFNFPMKKKHLYNIMTTHDTSDYWRAKKNNKTTSHKYENFSLT